MGFLSKIRNNMQNKVSKMPRSDMGFRDMGPGNMPRRPDIFGGNSFLFEKTRYDECLKNVAAALEI
jgi:hypothetical protein